MTTARLDCPTCVWVERAGVRVTYLTVDGVTHVAPDSYIRDHDSALRWAEQCALQQQHAAERAEAAS